MALSSILWALPWVVLAVAAPFVFTMRPRLRDCPPPPPEDAPLISAIVPARNEAVNIGACLGSLLHSHYARFEVIIVDDQSSDGTRDIARNLAERDGRVRLVEGQELPPGWLGKCWACWQGYREARGDVLLFTDADTRHEPELLGHAAGALRSSGAALVSLVPRQDMKTFWERIVLPHVFTVLAMRYPDLGRINRSRNPRDAIANGQFILIRRDAYEATGGHEAVRAEVVEDLCMAQRVVASGRRLFLANGTDLMRTRMYRSLSGIVEGWSKNLATGARMAVDPWLRPFVPWLLGLFVLALWVPPAAAFLLGTFGSLDHRVFGWGMLATAASLAFWFATMVRLRVPLPYAFAFPLGGAVTAFLIFRSAARGDVVRWKGRTYGGPNAKAPGTGGRNST